MTYSLCVKLFMVYSTNIAYHTTQKPDHVVKIDKFSTCLRILLKKKSEMSDHSTNDVTQNLKKRVNTRVLWLFGYFMLYTQPYRPKYAHEQIFGHHFDSSLHIYDLGVIQNQEMNQCKSCSEVIK